MKKFVPLFVAVLAMFSVSCTSTRIIKAPSVEATRAGITASQGKVASAQGKVTKAQSHVTKAQTSAGSTKKLVEQIRDAEESTDTIRELARRALGDVDTLTKELLETQAALADTQADLASTQQELAKSQANASKLQVDIQAQTDALNASNADLVKTKKAYHFIKFWAIGLAMALVGFVMFSIFKFAALSPPLLYVTIGAPLAVGTFLLFWL